ncbi:hypothetical protein OPT61_g1021 [Boeremia exigua]|uniref:Uncharacterized protein n=1 Tax=Boeremia exigua TaxID=749465 RepID=A0ACC2IS77_9PLEO|nr:hypothetical protein OPT61_g1021 [Boeremia exigua]
MGNTDRVLDLQLSLLNVRWAAIAAPITTYRHTGRVFHGEIFDSNPFGHQDRPLRQDSKTWSCVPNLITPKFCFAPNPMRRVGLREALSALPFYKETPCAEHETSRLTAQNPLSRQTVGESNTRFMARPASRTAGVGFLGASRGVWQHRLLSSREKASGVGQCGQRSRGQDVGGLFSEVGGDEGQATERRPKLDQEGRQLSLLMRCGYDPMRTLYYDDRAYSSTNLISSVQGVLSDILYQVICRVRMSKAPMIDVERTLEHSDNVFEDPHSTANMPEESEARNKVWNLRN